MSVRRWLLALSLSGTDPERENAKPPGDGAAPLLQQSSFNSGHSGPCLLDETHLRGKFLGYLSPTVVTIITVAGFISDNLCSIIASLIFTPYFLSTCRPTYLFMLPFLLSASYWFFGTYAFIYIHVDFAFENTDLLISLSNKEPEPCFPLCFLFCFVFHC